MNFKRRWWTDWWHKVKPIGREVLNNILCLKRNHHYKLTWWGFSVNLHPTAEERPAPTSQQMWSRFPYEASNSSTYASWLVNNHRHMVTYLSSNWWWKIALHCVRYFAQSHGHLLRLLFLGHVFVSHLIHLHFHLLYLKLMNQSVNTKKEKTVCNRTDSKL